MSEYNGRLFEVSINNSVFIERTDARQFKMTFEALQDFGGFTSLLDISFFNLAQSTSNNAFKRGENLTLSAGYRETIDVIFSGNIKNVLRERRGPNTVTRVLARGGRLVTDRDVIAKSLGSNVKVVDLIKACADSLDYPLVIEESDFSDIPPYARGYTLYGDPQQYLDKLALTHDFSYNLENERLVVVRNNSFRKGSVHEISQFTGMEGIPEITEVGADVTVRLNPKIKIGGRFEIKSQLATFNFSNLFFRDLPESAGKGEYRIFRLAHSGDSWGDMWSTKVTGIK